MLYRRYLKPAADFTLAAAGLVALSPVLGVLAAAIRLRLGSPVVFRQTRIGRDDRPFLFVKFRSMTDERDANGILLPDGKRLTPFGRFLRATSLDELPQLWNVVKGEMSLIGPRPLLPQYLPRYSPEQRRRHEVKPGITGWAQVNGRNSVTWDEKFRLDVWYVDHASFALDVKILAMTLVKLVRREGINQAGNATMEEFRGNAGSAQ
ncbi:MAG TPA: sugar transferase [Bryobacteraceae bacterium]|nr:sugar transferase [Bryobacteraceae bacterium]